MTELHLIAHNIRSRENVGALFRIADGLGIAKLWLTGYTPVPPHIRIEKASLGAEKSVANEYRESVDAAIAELRKSGFRIIALENAPDATALASFAATDKLALILGTETTGVPKTLLAAADEIIRIPQLGKKSSLNVAVAAAIASWHILHA